MAAAKRSGSREDDIRPSPFHAGEAAVQERCGVRERVEQIGHAIIHDVMPLQHRELFARLPTVIVGSLDADRKPWASVLAGDPGFLRASDERTLYIAARPDRGDPLGDRLAVGIPLGLLGIEPSTRRRNRMNGTVTAVDDEGFTVSVDQSFGNCPQYIQARRPEWRREPADRRWPVAVEATAGRLSGRARELVTAADTLFIASASPHARGRGGADGVDVSHRGGKPGFVRVTTAPGGGPSVLTLPDFRGNFLFNTLGNIAAFPRAGLLFIDFTSGDLLQVTGQAEIVWEGPELESFAGAQRLLVVTVEKALRRPGALPLRWSEPEFASQLEDTGAWVDPLP